MHVMRATTFGEDRYKRRYWVLPHAGGIYVESLESGELREDKDGDVKTEIKVEVKSEVKSEVTMEEKPEVKLEVQTETKSEIKMKMENEEDDNKMEVDNNEKKDSIVVNEAQSDDKKADSKENDNLESASTSQEGSSSKEELPHNKEEERTMDEQQRTEIERKFEQDLEGLIDRSLRESDGLDTSSSSKYGDYFESTEKKEEGIVNGIGDKMDTDRTENGPALQNGSSDPSEQVMSIPTKSQDGTSRDRCDTTDKDKQGYDHERPLSLEPKREVSSPSKASTPSQISTPCSSTRDVSSPSLSDSKSGFMNMDSILHRGTTQPYVLANPYAAATSAASPVIGQHLLSKGSDSKPNGTMGSWFSILPRMPCDDKSLTKTQTDNGASGSSENQLPPELKHNATAAAAMPFNVSPYGIYQMPFPLMHMNQMNPLMGAYTFPGFAGGVPMQAAMSAPLDLSNPMMSASTASPEFKVEVKKEDDDDEEDDDAENQAIATMTAMLEQMENAVTKPIPEGKT